MNTYYVTAIGYVGTMELGYTEDGTLKVIQFSEDSNWDIAQRRFALRFVPGADVQVKASFEDYRKPEDTKRVFTVETVITIPDFETAWQKYPADSAQKGSKAEAKNEFAKLSDNERVAAVAFYSTYKKNLAKTGQYPKHVVRYYRHRLWET